MEIGALWVALVSLVKQDDALMPQEEFNKILGRLGAKWTGFETGYPGASGLLTCPRVGFNAKEDKALSLIGYRCGDGNDPGGWSIDFGGNRN